MNRVSYCYVFCEYRNSNIGMDYSSKGYMATAPSSFWVWVSNSKMLQDTGRKENYKVVEHHRRNMAIWFACKHKFIRSPIFLYTYSITSIHKPPIAYKCGIISWMHIYLKKLTFISITPSLLIENEGKHTQRRPECMMHCDR